MKKFPVLVTAVALLLLTASPALASGPARERELTCTDGTIFTGEQVRNGFGTPPRTWRNVDPGASPAAFTFFAATVTAPGGEIVEQFSWYRDQGITQNHELITCSFIIPVGELTGYSADFIGYFVPG